MATTAAFADVGWHAPGLRRLPGRQLLHDARSCRPATRLKVPSPGDIWFLILYLGCCFIGLVGLLPGVSTSPIEPLRAGHGKPTGWLEGSLAGSSRHGSWHLR